MQGINWGDVPTWVAVGVAAVGGGVALSQLRQQGKVIKDEFTRNKRRDKLIDGQLRELKQREDSRRREQAERVDVTWDNISGVPDKSLVTVINGSRRPICDVSCKAYDGSIGGDGHAIRIELDYCAELIPDPGVGSFTFPKRPSLSSGWIVSLRGGARAGFQFQARRAAGPMPYALVEFTDDANNRWSLTSGLSLRPLESPPVPATDSVPSTSTS
jgi:hypothetical protein